MKKRVALYLRVSTKGQTVENQRRELEAVAARGAGRSLPSTRMPGSAAQRDATSDRGSTGC